MKRQPTVVIVGRPNVGKSTLFNRLTRSRRALVHDLPGVTRDRIVGEAVSPEGRVVTLVDTGGLVPGGEEVILAQIRTQAEAAIRDADVVLLLLDGAAGPVPQDQEIADYLRTLGVTVVPVVNKGDRGGVELGAHEFHRLGLGEPVVVSAEHGAGMDELWTAVAPFLGAEGPEEGVDVESGDEIQVAIVGRPNVGKSSLLNRLAGEPRVLVDQVPGTTRDAVDVVLEREGVRYRFVDTAGIRRKGRTEKGPEVLSVVLARRYLERAQICLVVIDVDEGITRQDGHVAGYAWEAGRAVALVVNKWDLVTDGDEARRRIEDQVTHQLKFLHRAPLVTISALTGRGVHRLYPLLGDLYAAYRTEVGTAELNRLVRDAWLKRPPPTGGRSEAKLFYCSQVHRAPPHFVLFTNLSRPPHFSYLRYLENELRGALGLEGVPIRVMIKGRTH